MSIAIERRRAMRARYAALAVMVLLGLSASACTTSRPRKAVSTVEAGAGQAASPMEQIGKRELLRRALTGLSFSSGYVEIDDGIAERTPDRGGKGPARQRCRQAAELLGRNNRVEAIRAYKEAILTAPDYAGAYYGLGQALLTKGKTEFAIAAFRTALRIQPQFADAQFRLAFALGMAARWQEAIAEYRRLLEIDPQYPAAHARLAGVLYYSGDIEAAQESADAAGGAQRGTLHRVLGLRRRRDVQAQL